MPRGIKKYAGPLSATLGPLYNTDGEGGGVATAPPAVPAPPAAPAADEQLGDNGKKALEREREARKLLEKQVQGFESQMAALAQAFGVKPPAGSDGADLVDALSSQVAALQHQALVDRVARVHGITDPEALDILSTAKDEQAMAKRAEWLNATKAPPTPKPDASQGAKGDPNKPDPGPGVARLAAAFEDEFDK